jgi:hypothetical protein
LLLVISTLFFARRNSPSWRARVVLQDNAVVANKAIDI